MDINDDEKITGNNINDTIKKIKTTNPQIEKEVNEMKDSLLKDISKESRRNGTWFFVVLKKVIESHANNVNAEYFQSKYKTAVKDTIAKKIINVNRNYSIITGATLGVGGGLFGLYAAIPATFGEIATLTYLQLRMIYDLSVIYDKPIDFNDPEEAYKIIKICLGIKMTETAKGFLAQGTKKGSEMTVGILGRRAVLRPTQDMFNAIGIKITQRAIKNAMSKMVPVAGALIGGSVCALIDYNSTKMVAKNSLSIYRTPKLLVEIFDNKNAISIDNIKDYDILLKGCLFMVNSDQDVDIHKTVLIEHICRKTGIVNQYQDRVKILEDDFLIR